MDVQGLLEQNVTKYTSKPAFIFREKKISFSELRTQIFKFANVLRSAGVCKGDKIAVYLPNCPEYAYSYLAGFCLGAVIVPLDYMLKNDELISCLTHSETKILIGQPRNDVSFSEIKANVPTLKKMFILEGEATGDFLSFYGEMAKATEDFSRVQIAETDPALIMYTSGTTGKPKGILLTYKHLDGSPEAMHHFVDLSNRDVKLSALPLSHIAGLIYIQNCLTFGITLVIMERFNPFEFLKNIQDYKITCFHIVPAMYTALLTLKGIDKFDLSSLRWVVVFGAPSTPEILERFHKYCPNARLLNGWGMTETCPPNTVTPLGHKNIASIGKPSPICKIKIVDDAGHDVPAGEIGEIIISGWVIMKEYYKDPAATAQMKKDGWLYTGDLGRFDAEGFLYIVGRKKEMIKVGGQIVYAPEVEAAFYKHEAIAEVAVIGVSDKLRGEAVKAFVVLKEGSNISAEDLRYFAKEHLAHFKVPQTIEVRDILPKNRTGKIYKETLIQQSAAV